MKKAKNCSHLREQKAKKLHEALSVRCRGSDDSFLGFPCSILTQFKSTLSHI